MHTEQSKVQCKMSIILTPLVLERTYELLVWTHPFVIGNLPDSEDVVFKVTRSHDLRGTYHRDTKDRHIIEISSCCNRTLDALIRTMAHEMCHLMAGAVFGDRRDVMHSKIVDATCKRHGWDIAMF